MIQMKEFRESRKLSPREIVEVVQEDAPRFDRYLLSKCEHPEKYGIRLLNEIEQNLAEAFPLTVPESRKPDLVPDSTSFTANRAAGWIPFSLAISAIRASVNLSILRCVKSVNYI